MFAIFKMECVKMTDFYNYKLLPLFLYMCISMCSNIWPGHQTVLFNHNLDSGYCVKNLPKISFSECYSHLESGNFSFNVIVYRRAFLLCKLCYVSQILNIRREPGFVLVHSPISGNSFFFLFFFFLGGWGC